MAEKSLRAYNKEIEQLIERGQTEEAIGHCKYILKSFPKHLETYRLLAKAYLESKRLGEATDIFQRVLSSVPDDFVSHIGMSMIREDEGNMDAAIWHMERAYEVQPANHAVQEELRRLYGRRDGLQPPRIRLTRAALVRMYARGDLNQQAIAEARAALAEEPQRIDLIVLMAKILFTAGQRVEATERCSEIIQKYPYNYDANQILANILKDTSRAEDAKIYQQRVIAMDPYAGYLTNKNSDPASVPDDIVSLEQLDWKSIPAEERQQPEWATSLGIDISQAKEGGQELPEWVVSSLQSQPDQVPPTSSFIIEEEPETPTAVQPTPAIIPDWLKEAGWTESTGEFDEQGVIGSQIPEPAPTVEEAVAGEIPDWLQTFAPEESKEEALSSEADKEFQALFSDKVPTDSKPEGSDTSPFTGDEIPDWLPQQPLVQEQEESSFESVGEPQAFSKETPALPEQPFAAEGLLEDQIPTPSEDASFAWLESLAAKQGAEEEELLLQPEQRLEEPPAWVSEKAVGETGAEVIPADENVEAAAPAELPDWLKDLTATQVETTPEIIANEPAVTQEVISTSGEPIADETERETASVEPGDSESEAAFAWLEKLAAKQGAVEDELLVKPDERLEKPPEWVQELVQQPEPGEPSTIGSSEGITPESEQEIVPSFELEDMPKTEEPVTLVEEGAPAEAESVIESTTTLPDWLTKLSAETTSEEPTPIATSPDWLTNLPVETPAEEPETTATPPDWLTKLPVETPTEEPETVATSPDWLAGLSDETHIEEPEPAATEASAETAGERPDWLLEPEPALSIADTQPAAIQPPVVSDEIPDWLKSMENAPTDQVKTEEQPASEVLAERGEADTEAALSWLEGLAAKQGALEEELTFKPEERLATPPEWVASTPEMLPETPAEEAAQETIAPTEELPDWLKEITAEPEIAREELVLPSEVVETGTGEVAVEVHEPILEMPAYEETPVTVEDQPVVEEATLAELIPTPAVMVTIPEAGEMIDQQQLAAAQAALSAGKLSEALILYQNLINKGIFLDEAIHDLREGLYHFPVDVVLWQTLGDAYIQENRVQDALDAYTQAEELLR